MRILLTMQNGQGNHPDRVVEMAFPPRIGEFFESGERTWRVSKVTYTPDAPKQDVVVVLVLEGGR